MYSIRRNFYNKNIFMIHKEKLVAILSKTDNLLLKKQICMLIKKYEYEKNFLDEVPYELRSWPNYYIGLSKSDEMNSSIINLAIQDSMDDSLFFMDVDCLNYACGCAYLEGNFELANELSKIKGFFSPSCSGTIKDVLKVVTKDTLNYLLAYIQTHCKVNNDERIVYYDGEKFTVLSTIRLSQKARE